MAAAIADKVPLERTMDGMEYGCGTGLVTLLLASRLRRIDAVDTSAEMRRQLQQKIAARGVRNVHTYCLDLDDKSADLSPRYDLVFTSMTLHHIADTTRLIRHFAALLKPGGYIAIADLDREDGSFHGDKPGVLHQGFDRTAIGQAMQSAGLDRPHMTTAYAIERPQDDGAVRRYPVFLACAASEYRR